jgi:hypothetical protein
MTVEFADTALVRRKPGDYAYRFEAIDSMQYKG